ncbi:glyoxylase-like metal-dependent hydrolase (beta-lactamase superfamily II) [Orbus hercynius]|uniref:Glyoxylase-like metal-dependent hydrolase (Beta-lactamase superfamily II) n=1 Tax=Orbus hercynius TaxID=593135 RepID=A0A495RD06_9GAMM|nr:MBL fold metallo-hydrolase [Orbus hercynius]RKS85160.1 glyoxylase-like metal-dependent hydrolase (beta-lactamase superfamily II) [Orbus hercynius]
MRSLQRLVLLFSLVVTLAACATQQAGKISHFDVYNSGSKAIFPVTSTIFYTQNEAMLIDAQFTAQDAEQLVKQIQQSGKPLSLIYISQSDPDFYFGLETILAAYPNARVVATPATVERIKQSGTDKLKYWRTKLGKQAPTKIVIPQALAGNVIHFGDEVFDIKGSDALHTYLWLPSRKMIVGGSLLSNNMYVWTADAKTVRDRLYWDNTIFEMLALQPSLAIPGHYLGNQPMGIEALEFTHQYLKTFDYILLTRDSSKEVIASMKKLYPGLGGEMNLEMSTKITLGEMAFN